MNSEPCVRFGMRISPKISEKPADSRNRRPPKVTLLTVSTSQKFIAVVFPPVPRRIKGAARAAPFGCCVPLWFERRIVARIDRLRQELLFVVGPELTDVVIGLHGLVPELQP